MQSDEITSIDKQKKNFIHESICSEQSQLKFDKDKNADIKLTVRHTNQDRMQQKV